MRSVVVVDGDCYEEEIGTPEIVVVVEIVVAVNAVNVIGVGVGVVVVVVVNEVVGGRAVVEVGGVVEVDAVRHVHFQSMHCFHRKAF